MNGPYAYVEVLVTFDGGSQGPTILKWPSDATGDRLVIETISAG